MPRRTPRAALGVLALVVALVMAVAAACGSADPPREISQTVQFTATEYAFSADASTTISAGEFVRVEFVNEGTLVHEMQVLDGRGRLIDRVDRLPPGASGSVDIEFEQPGVYQLICDIDDHLSRGQRASFTVDP